MRNLYIFLSAIFTSCLFLNCTNENTTESSDQGPYSISGTIENPVDSGLVILSIFDPVSQAKTAIDTFMLMDSTYTLNFDFEEPDLFRIDYFKTQNVMLVIDEGQNKIQVNVDGKRKGKVEITGSEDAQKMLGYDNFRQESYDRVIKPTYDAMRAATKLEDVAGEVAAVEAYAIASEASRKELIDYTEENIGTSIALFGTMLRWTGDDEVERLDKLVQSFKAVRPDLKMTKVMEDKVNRFKKVAIGAIAPVISLPDSTGTVKTLGDLKGTYTLLDFWASWCGPCLLQVPDLKDAYDIYHEKGFEIIGVSVDSKGDRWKNSIQKYEMNWPHISDLKGWQSEAAAEYNVTFIPFNMLIDSDGKILAKNLHSKALQGKLEELFAKDS